METFKQIFKPNRAKIILDIIVVVIYLAIIFAIPSLGIGQKFAGFNFFQLSLSLALSFLIVAVVYYPLVCGLLGVFNFIKKPDNFRGLIISCLLVLIFNPLTFHQGAKLLGTNNQPPAQDLSTKNCGLAIVNFSDFSKAKNTGLKINDVVTEVDGLRINSVNDIIKNSQAKRPGDTTDLKTDRGIFKVELVSDPVNNGPVLGIKFNDAKCQEDSNNR